MSTSRSRSSGEISSCIGGPLQQCLAECRRLTSGQSSPSRFSTRHVEDRIGVFGVLLQDLDSFKRREHQQFDLVTLGLALYFFHHRQSTVSPGTDHEAAAFPGNLLLNGQRRVSKVVAELLRRLFLAFADLPAVNEDIMRVS